MGALAFPGPVPARWHAFRNTALSLSAVFFRKEVAVSDRTTTFSANSLECLESRVLLASDYRIIDLGTLGGDTSVATAINERGQVVGYSTNADGQTRAFLYSNGRMRSIGSPKGDSRATDINDRGHIGGYFLNNSGSARGFVYKQREFQVMELLEREGSRQSFVYAVGHNGRAYGQSNGRPVMWREADPRALSRREGAVFNVNRRRTAVGVLRDDPYTFRPALALDDGDGGAGRALDINKNRQAVGWQSVGGDRQAVLWKLSASQEQVLRRTVIGGLGEGPGNDTEFSTASAINNDGLVVGSSLADDLQTRHAFLYEDGEIHDLNDLLEDGDDWLLVSANDINEAGQIIGTGVINGQEHAFLLEPIVEGPDATLTLDGREIDDGDTVDFGSVRQGAPRPTREFVISNEGRERLSIDDVEVPNGFVLVDELPEFLDPGEIESFRIALSTNQAGSFRGTVTISTNEADEGIEFDVLGRVVGNQNGQGPFGGDPFDGFPVARPRR